MLADVRNFKERESSKVEIKKEKTR